MPAPHNGRPLAVCPLVMPGEEAAVAEVGWVPSHGRRFLNGREAHASLGLSSGPRCSPPFRSFYSRTPTPRCEVTSRSLLTLSPWRPCPSSLAQRDSAVTVPGGILSTCGDDLLIRVLSCPCQICPSLPFTNGASYWDPSMYPCI
ncbi:hypothetical protein SKAU_G00322760 [Synaphobranchus kaupii]|uniref:Uncharacterized protein n=1 Tax=Synaphobranchus kaupii TaxID=118154 RepID=A0A9Q1EP68_SYNKA|nr:hypothetical protein SKAU_G00322760 [Synaphobranchus kaupii]